MSNYTKITDFTAKDGLASGDPNKVVSGQLFADEFNAIATAVATKAELADVQQPAPPKIARIDAYRSPDVNTMLDYDNRFVDTATDISFTALDLPVNGIIYRLSITFTTSAGFVTVYNNGLDPRRVLDASLFVRITNTTSQVVIDTNSLIISKQQAIEDDSSLVFTLNTIDTVPHHSEFFLDLSSMTASNSLDDYTFTLYYQTTSNTQNNTATGDLFIKGSVDMVLEEVL